MLIRWQDKELTLPPGTSVRDCLAALGISEGALAAMRGGQVLELNETLREDSELNPITLRHEEGRRIYERCLRMMMLLAVRRLYPGEQVRIEYSAGHGVFVRLPRLSLSEGMVAEIEQEMRRIADAGLPLKSAAGPWRTPSPISRRRGSRTRWSCCTTGPSPTSICTAWATCGITSMGP